MNQLRNSVDNEKYFFLSNIKEFDGVKTFNLEDIFSNGEQIRSFPTVDEKGRKLYAVIFDEINLQFNRRMNKSSDYNNLFIGLIEFLVSHRHQDVPRVYFIGQKLELQDGQLQSLFKYQHDIIRTKRWPAYWYYKEHEKVVFIKHLGATDVIFECTNTLDSCGSRRIIRNDCHHCRCCPI